MDGQAIDPTANPGENEPLRDADGNIIDAPPSNINEEVKADMDNIWRVFDPNKEDKVTIDELATIMRALDVDVKDEDVLDMIRAMIDPDNKGHFSYEDLTRVMEE